jgi:hypothetical protein
MQRTILAILVIFAIILSGCSNSSDEQISQAYTAAAETIVVQATSPPTPEVSLPTSTPLPTPTATPTWVTTAFVINGPLNLRKGPGLLFDSYGNLTSQTKLYVLGTIPGGDWLEVLAPNPIEDGQVVGWVFTNYLEIANFSEAIPIVSWPQEMTIYGTVTDDNGTPVNGVRVAALYQTESEELRDDTPTNENGEFTLYIPKDISGPFDVQITAVNCNSWISVWLDGGECAVLDYFQIEWRSTEFVPLAQPVHFYFEQAVTQLEGKIHFADGWGYPGVLVKATRMEDGIESERVSPNNGRFSIPLGYGTWEVVAIRFERDGTPYFSERVIHTITEENQEIEPFDVVIDNINKTE